MAAADDTPDLAGLGADVAVPDRDAAAALDSSAGIGRPAGRLGELARWIASVQGHAPQDFQRSRLVVLGGEPAPIDLTCLADMGVVAVVPEHSAAAGVQVADDEVDRGADLLVLAIPDVDVAALTVISVLTNTEPVKVLPRGTALDPTAWMAQAVSVRDARRAAFAMREDAAALLTAIGAPVLDCAVAMVLRAAGRRTPMVLDGPGAVAAGLLAHAVQPRTAQWWQVADRVQHPGVDIATAKLDQVPILDLGIDTADGTAGALAVLVLRAAACSGTGRVAA